MPTARLQSMIDKGVREEAAKEGRKWRKIDREGQGLSHCRDHADGPRILMSKRWRNRLNNTVNSRLR